MPHLQAPIVVLCRVRIMGYLAQSVGEMTRRGRPRPSPCFRGGPSPASVFFSHPGFSGPGSFPEGAADGALSRVGSLWPVGYRGMVRADGVRILARYVPIPGGVPSLRGVARSLLA